MAGINTQTTSPSRMLTNEIGHKIYFAKCCQACTEMVLLTGGAKEDSLFPASNYSYNGRLEYCKEKYNVVPRPTWAPTEFGAYVSEITPILGISVS